MADRFDPMTPDGTPLNEAVSAMIKELRRGKDLQALYWAKQIEERFFKYVWKRLLIFAAEDVSVANPDAIVQVNACYAAYMLTREKVSGGNASFCMDCGTVQETSPAEGKADKDVLALAVLILARSPKCRESNLMWAMLIELEKVGWKPGVPEYALDGHTKRGRALHTDRNERHVMWFTEWSRVEPNGGPNDAQAWHLRRMVAQNRMSREHVVPMIAKFVEKDQLKYDLDQKVWPEWEEANNDASRCP